MNLYKHAKNQAFSSFYCRDIFDFKTCNLIAQEHFGPYLRNRNFPKYEIYIIIYINIYKYYIINIFFIIHQTEKKLMTKFSDTFKEPKAWPIFPSSGAKYHFQRIWLSSNNTTWAPNTMLSSRKN